MENQWNIFICYRQIIYQRAMIAAINSYMKNYQIAPPINLEFVQ